MELCKATFLINSWFSMLYQFPLLQRWYLQSPINISTINDFGNSANTLPVSPPPRNWFISLPPLHRRTSQSALKTQFLETIETWSARLPINFKFIESPTEMQPVGKNSNFKGTNILLLDSKNSYKLDLWKNCISLYAILLTKIIVTISEP